MFKRLQKLFRPEPSPVAPSLGDGPDVLVNAYCTRELLPAMTFPHELHARRDLTDPELPGHLGGFVGYVLQCGGGEMTRIRYHTMRHIQRVRQHLSLSVEQPHFEAFARWAGEANAILFLPDGSVRDPHGRLLLSPTAGEAPDPQADLPYPVQAWQRKQRSDALLAGKSMAASATLPPLVSEPEVWMRTPAEVAGRALALFVVAVAAEGVATGEPLPMTELQQRFPHAFRHLSPREQSFLDTAAPERDTTVAMAWRYEALLVLAWALSLIDALPFPSAICDVPSLARTLMAVDAEQLLQTATLRSDNELLDALDLHYRLHWLIRQAKLNGQAPREGLEGGVIAERHHALNWLVRFEDKAWDRVDTPT